VIGRILRLAWLVTMGATVHKVATSAHSGSSSGKTDRSGIGHLAPDEAKALALDAYVYGYALVTVEMTRRVMTNVDRIEAPRAPMGQLMRMREYPNAQFRDVTAPNADTLYVNGFIDVKDEPWVLSLPEAHDRHYLFPMLDGYTNVFEVPGKRTTGTGPQTYAITGPGWQGTLPAGVTEYKSPTAMVWLLGRIYCTGTPEDYAAVHEMQDAISLIPLSSYGKPYTPPAGTVDPGIDMKTPVREQVNNLSAEAYFNLMAALMKDNPPAEADRRIVDKMAELGIVAGEKFDVTKLGPDVAATVRSVPKLGFDTIMARFQDLQNVNGWRFTTQTGQYGTDYLQRALVTAIGLGANRPQDAVYPTSEADIDGQTYDGANTYTVHLDEGQFPPANGFWSVTMYDEGYFFVDNPINRYTLGQRNTFATNPDGSLDLYLQHDNPGPEREANWLPAPAGKFNLMMRLYWPKVTQPSILDGTWKPPAVTRVS
jgi:hypothetical protein